MIDVLHQCGFHPSFSKFVLPIVVLVSLQYVHAKHSLVAGKRCGGYLEV